MKQLKLLIKTHGVWGNKGIFKSREKLEFHPPGAQSSRSWWDPGILGISGSLTHPGPGWEWKFRELRRIFAEKPPGKGPNSRKEGWDLGEEGPRGGSRARKGQNSTLNARGNFQSSSTAEFPLFFPDFLLFSPYFSHFFQPGEGEFGNGKRGRSFGLKTRDFGQSFQICREFSPKESQ